MDIPNYDPNDIRMDGEGTCPHTDTTTGKVGTPPTCTEDGYSAQIVCAACGAEVEAPKKTADKLGHDPKTVKGTAATCTSPGKTDGQVCNRCGAVLTAQTAIDPLGHSYGEDGICTRTGCSAKKESGGGSYGTPSDEEKNEEDTEVEGNGAGEEGISVEQEKASEPVAEEEEVEEAAVATTIATEPKGDDGEGFHLCNPFTCGCWIYLILALVIGIVAGFLVGSHSKKKKAKKRRPRPYTEVDYAVAMPTVAEAPVFPVTQQSAAAGVTAAVHHHVGARKDQQDSYGVSDLNAYAATGVLAVVADGMGGLANGKAVSSNLVHGMLNYFRQTTGQESVPDMMLDMLTQSNDQINRMLQGADRSGSTLVSAIIRNGEMHFLTVGDSRIYLYRHGRLLQLNREHIYQEELALKAVNHIIPLAQVTGDRQAHALTSYLGIGRLTHLDRNYEGIKLEPGDKIMLASDGVFGTLSQAEMEAALRNGIGEATDIIGEKIRIANMQYQDNNTALVLEFHG